jgi:hypothetical protein
MGKCGHGGWMIIRFVLLGENMCLREYWHPPFVNGNFPSIIRSNEWKIEVWHGIHWNKPHKNILAQNVNEYYMDEFIPLWMSKKKRVSG